MKFIILIILLTLKLFAQNENISLQLQWKHQFQFAGFYVAKEKGFYHNVGLDVDIKEYKHSIDIINDVVSGKSKYGLGKSSLLISKNMGKPIVALAAIYQTSPLVLISTNPNIKLPIDLLDKKIMITTDAVESASINSMLLSNGVGKGDFFQQKHSFNYNDLINGKTDAMACYLSNEPYYFKEKKISYKTFNPRTYGYDFYGDILFTSKNEFDNNPKRVKSFLSASKKGWLWAFENIEETAKLIYKKYNTQNKSLDSLIYEGHILKELALVENIPFGHISKNKLQEIAKVYQLGGLLDNDYTLEGFLDPLGINKFQVKIGVLAKRGVDMTYKRWDPLSKYLNKQLDTYNFSIVPLSFSQLEDSIKNKSVDFIITNTMFYVLLENKYGISRIATLINSDVNKKYKLKEFGGVIFTKNDNKEINEISDLDSSIFGAVSELSFGGWIMGYEELYKNGIQREDINLRFLNTHDNVVKAVLSGEIDAGTVRIDTLERMEMEGLINLSAIKIIGAKKYNNFPYLVSTKLYPEWPIAKLVHTPDTLANKLLAELVTYKPTQDDIKLNKIWGWTVPMDYTPVHQILKELKLPPYDKQNIKFIDILNQYSLYFYILGLIIVVVIARLIYDWRMNIYLNKYSHILSKEVKKQTKELLKANEKLQIIANTDALTGISSRGYFMKFAKKYFDIAKRNKENLQILSLDLDYFKNINDTYGHKAGDDVLKEFSRIISELLRKSDMFGRIGGEEFCILLQNTHVEGACLFSQRVCETIENMVVESDEYRLKITVSIGMVTLSNEDSIEELMKKSDKALYEAKENGRNQVKVYV